MENLAEMTNEVMDLMMDVENTRVAAINLSRSVIRCTKTVIHSIHTGFEDKGSIEQMKIAFDKLLDAVDKEPFVFYGNAVEDAMMEYSEAMLFRAMVNDGPLPSYKDLEVTPQTWALGLCDCLGEMRRILLKYLMESDMDSAKRIFKCMEELSDVIMAFDVADAIAPLRRKQDIARGIMERSRSDMTTATIMRGLKNEY